MCRHCLQIYPSLSRENEFQNIFWSISRLPLKWFIDVCLCPFNLLPSFGLVAVDKIFVNLVCHHSQVEFRLKIKRPFEGLQFAGSFFFRYQLVEASLPLPCMWGIPVAWVLEVCEQRIIGGFAGCRRNSGHKFSCILVVCNVSYFLVGVEVGAFTSADCDSRLRILRSSGRRALGQLPSLHCG